MTTENNEDMNVASVEQIETEKLPSKNKKYRSVLLLNEAYLTLRSRIARYYFYKGGDKEGIGVMSFNKQVREIWQAAEQDDPYADLFLLRVYDALVGVRREIRQRTKHYREFIQEEINLDWKTTLSDEPMKIKLYFKLSYGYMAANLIADFDNYACLLYSAKMMGVMLDRPINELLQQMGDKIKTTFELPQKWKRTDVTREDVNQQNDKATLAKECMGSINEKVLTGILRSPYAPKIKKNIEQNEEQS